MRNMGKRLKKLGKWRQKARAKARGMTVEELKAYEADKKRYEKIEKAKYLQGKAQREARQKYSKKRAQDKERGPGWRGALARFQDYGERLGQSQRKLIGPARDPRTRPNIEELVFGSRKKRKRRR